MTSRAALVDGHVHLHACFDIDTAFDVAKRNLDSVRSKLHLPAATSDVLWLAELRDERATDRLRASLAHGGRWQPDVSDGAIMRLQHSEHGHKLTVVFGRQIRTAENLEILVVGTMEQTPSGRPLEETVEASLDQDALVMIPWGFGKWTGARGRTVARAYERFSAQGVRLADTGAHSRFRGDPGVFVRSIADENPILSGSDPFPFPDQIRAIGRTGFVLTDIPADFGWPDMLSAVASLKGQPRRFGRSFRTTEFARLQVKMQLRKRFGGGGRV